MKKYWREFPWILQFFLLMTMMFTLMSLYSVFLQSLSPKIWGYAYTELIEVNENSNPGRINANLTIQAFFSIFTFGLPALIFAYLTHPDWKKYLGLRLPQNKMHLLYAVLIMIGALPVLLASQELMRHLDFIVPSAKALQESNDARTKAFLSNTSFEGLLVVITVMSIIPAICEEFLFRGALMRVLSKKYKTIVTVLISSTFFALVHYNFYGLPGIFCGGIILAYIYIYTGSLWCNILAHLFFNGIQVALSFYANTHASSALSQQETVPWLFVIAGALLFAASFYAMQKSKIANTGFLVSDFGENEKQS